MYYPRRALDCAELHFKMTFFVDVAVLKLKVPIEITRTQDVSKVHQIYPQR